MLKIVPGSLSLCFMVFAIGFTAIDGARAATPRNVLLITVDDLNNDLRCYGHATVQSPHIDSLAARGVRFDRAYCQYPVCNPSRSSFLTSLYPDQTGVLSNAAKFRDRWPNVLTLPQLFRKHGYFVARVGKIFHYGVPRQIGTNGEDDPESWDFVVNPRGRDCDDEALIKSIAPHRRFGGTLSWLAAEGTDDEQTDAIGAAAAIEILEKNKNHPFFLAVGFYRPHTPYVAPKRYFDMYPRKKISLVVEPKHELDDIPFFSWVNRPYQLDMTEETMREILQAYHASITFMDAQVGKLLDALDRLELTDNTLIVFVSDHGYHMGEHRLWQKSSLFENSARVPLIIASVGAKGNGEVSGAVVEMVDIYPTVAGLCGLPIPEHVMGTNLAPVLQDPSLPGKKSALTQVVSRIGFPENIRRSHHVHGYSIRTPRWRYTQWDAGAQGIELYDHEADPREFHNIAGKPENRETVNKLRAILEDKLSMIQK